MKRNLIVSDAAWADVMEAALFIASQNKGVARRFVDAAQATFDLIESTPGGGTRRKSYRKELAGLRSWPVKGFRTFLVFYLVSDDSVRVIRVIHGARNIGQLFDEGEK